MMMEDQRRRDEEARRRDEEARRRDEKEARRHEEEIRRREEEAQRREEILLNTLKELSLNGSGGSVTDKQEFKRRTERCFKGIRWAIMELESATKREDKARLSALSMELRSKMESYERFFENKVDLLDGDEDKDSAIDEWETLRRKATLTLTEAQAAMDELKKLDNAGALPDSVKVPVFFGDMMLYPIWWEEFKAIVHDNKKVSQLYKMKYLKEALKGSAAHVLEGLGALAENYPKGVKLVQQRFGRKRVVVRHLVRSLAKMEPLTSTDPRAFLELVDKLTSRFTTLKGQATGVNQIIIPLLEDKLPQEIRQEWERHLGMLVDDDSDASEDQFFEFLRKEAATRIASANHDPTKDQSKKLADKDARPNKPTATSKPSVFSAAALPTTTRKETVAKVDGCELCGGAHEWKECATFLAMTPHARRVLVESNYRCRVCFEKRNSHPDGKYCTTVCSTPGCTFMHHHLLCSYVQSNELNDGTAVISNCATQEVIANVAMNSDVLLPTAIAKFRGETTTHMGRVGFDTFSQSTFVTKQMADELGLSLSKPVKMTIRGFGNRPSTKVFHQTELEIIPRTSSKGIRIQALVCEGKICDTLAAVPLDPKRYEYLKNIPLADCLPRGPVQLDVLVGADFYGSFVKSMVAAPDDGLPYVLRTAVGNVLAGTYPTFESSSKYKNCMITMHGRPSPVPVECDEGCMHRIEQSIERFWNVEAIDLVDEIQICTRETSRGQMVK